MPLELVQSASLPWPLRGDFTPKVIEEMNVDELRAILRWTCAKLEKMSITIAFADTTDEARLAA